MKKQSSLYIITTIIGTLISLSTIIVFSLKIREEIATKKDIQQIEQKINIKIDTTTKYILAEIRPMTSISNNIKNALIQHIRDQKKYDEKNTIWKDSIYYNQLLILNGLSEKKIQDRNNELTVLKK